MIAGGKASIRNNWYRKVDRGLFAENIRSHGRIGQGRGRYFVLYTIRCSTARDSQQAHIRNCVARTGAGSRSSRRAAEVNAICKTTRDVLQNIVGDIVGTRPH